MTNRMGDKMNREDMDRLTAQTMCNAAGARFRARGWRGEIKWGYKRSIVDMERGPGRRVRVEVEGGALATLQQAVMVAAKRARL